ncbi:hypothetical protein MHYP_G00119400 [Metynnis hypsauchen]
MDRVIKFREDNSSSEISYVSMKSDWSMGQPPDFRVEDRPADLRVQKNSDSTRRSMDTIFKELEHKVVSLVKNQLKRFVQLLSLDYPACSEREVEDEEDQSDVREGVLKITLTVLRNMNQTDLADTLHSKLAPSYHHKLKSTLKEKFQRIHEGISNSGTSTLLNEIYTELYDTEGGSGEVNTEHEWSAVVFVLLNLDEELDEFDLRKYDPSEECLLRLLPVVKASKKAVLASCKLTTASCEKLSSALQSVNSSLKELDLSYNDLQDSVVELLSAGLKSSHCKLETLRLAGCNLNIASCETLSSALQSVNSSLKELDLSYNDLQDSGVELLSAGLKSSHCKLDTLRLSGCMVTVKGCSSLVLALKSNPSHLRELDLTYNHPGESGVKLLSDLLEDPHCKLEKLQVDHGGKIRIKPGPQKFAASGSVVSANSNALTGQPCPVPLPVLKSAVSYHL